MGNRMVNGRSRLNNVCFNYFVIYSPTFWWGLSIFTVGASCFGKWGHKNSGSYPHEGMMVLCGACALILSPLLLPLALVVDIVKLVLSPVFIPIMYSRYEED